MNGLKEVNFKVWIPVKYEVPEGKQYQQKVANTGCWSDDYEGQGWFHQWGLAYQESDNGVGNYSTAIVQLSDGSIIEVLPTNIKFI